MARFNEILVGRYNRMLQKLFSMKGSPPAAQLASEIGATIEIERVSVDQRWLSGTRCGARVQQVAGVGNTSQIRLRNPAGTNTLITLEKFLITSLTANQEYTITASNSGSAAVNLVNSAGGRFIDGRSGGAGHTLVISSSNGADPSLLVEVQRFATILSTPYEHIVHEDQEITLSPSEAIQLTTINNHVALDLSLMWRERALEDSEQK